jgi:hypothetical protein
MKGSKIAPWISIMVSLLWFYAALVTDEKRARSITLGVVFLLLGLIQLRVNRDRFKDEQPPSKDEDIS